MMLPFAPFVERRSPTWRRPPASSPPSQLASWSRSVGAPTQIYGREVSIKPATAEFVLRATRIHPARRTTGGPAHYVPLLAQPSHRSACAQFGSRREEPATRPSSGSLGPTAGWHAAFALRAALEAPLFKLDAESLLALSGAVADAMAADEVSLRPAAWANGPASWAVLARAAAASRRRVATVPPGDLRRAPQRVCWTRHQRRSGAAKKSSLACSPVPSSRQRGRRRQPPSPRRPRFRSSNRSRVCRPHSSARPMRLRSRRRPRCLSRRRRRPRRRPARPEGAYQGAVAPAAVVHGPANAAAGPPAGGEGDGGASPRSRRPSAREARAAFAVGSCRYDRPSSSSLRRRRRWRPPRGASQAQGPRAPTGAPLPSQPPTLAQEPGDPSSGGGEGDEESISQVTAALRASGALPFAWGVRSIDMSVVQPAPQGTMEPPAWGESARGRARPPGCAAVSATYPGAGNRSPGGGGEGDGRHLPGHGGPPREWRAALRVGRVRRRGRARPPGLRCRLSQLPWRRDPVPTGGSARARWSRMVPLGIDLESEPQHTAGILARYGLTGARKGRARRVLE